MVTPMVKVYTRNPTPEVLNKIIYSYFSTHFEVGKPMVIDTPDITMVI
jgi:hypothetical protein